MCEDVGGDFREVVGPHLVFWVEEEPVRQDIEDRGPNIADELSILDDQYLDEFFMRSDEYICGENVGASEFALLKPGGDKFLSG